MIDSGNVNTALAQTFPLHLLGKEYVHDIDAARDLLSDSRGGLDAFALRECLATRLNVKSDELGWYSRPENHFGGHSYTWQIWNAADWFFRADVPFFSYGLCRALN